MSAVTQGDVRYASLVAKTLEYNFILHKRVFGCLKPNDVHLESEPHDCFQFSQLLDKSNGSNLRQDP